MTTKKLAPAGQGCIYKAKRLWEGRWVDGRGHEIFGEPGDKLGPVGRPVCFRPWDDDEPER